ncbi:hypothetical protein Y047_5553 [Burkholderia pseudomallei MSHR3016]|nr:hypothetical protein Y047_5553 [Burkholderia pseudomallei MSHR3016]
MSGRREGKSHSSKRWNSTYEIDYFTSDRGETHICIENQEICSVGVPADCNASKVGIHR